MNQEKDWGVPDWHEVNLYPDPEHTIPDQWAWEFLRRNHKYRRFWREEFEPFYDATDGFDGEKCRKAQGWSYERVDASKFDGYKDPIREARKQFGVLMPADPRDGNSTVFFETTALCFRNGPAFIDNITLNKSEVLVWFDLRLPINPQVQNCQNWLTGRLTHLTKTKNFKTEKHRKRVQCYPTYLRLLDAKACKAETPEILRYIYLKIKNEYPENGGQDALRKDLASAKKLRDYDYRFIPITRTVKSGK